MLESQKPLISVLIPSLNSQDYIGECIESVLNQTFGNIEIICIDAGSTDETLNIINSHIGKDSRIRLINSDKKSYGYQMNMGLNNSNGEYLAIVESDDYIDKSMFEELYDLALKFDAEIAKSTFYHFYDYSDGQKLKIDNAKKKIEGENPFNIYQQPLFFDGHPSIWAGIYKLDFLRENDICFMEEKGAGWVDNPFFYETTFLANKIVYTHVPYYYYRETNPNSSSNSLGDFTIPVLRMLDNLDVVDKYECSDELVLKHVYLRAFAYIYNILRRDGHEEHMDEVRPLIQEMLLRLDENIVLRHMPQKHIGTYYKFISPVNMLEEGDVLSKNDLNLIKKENEYLYSQIKEYEKKLSNSKKDIKKLKNEMKVIKNSNSNKSDSKFTKVIRRFKL